jgi:hypothetical protein
MSDPQPRRRSVGTIRIRGLAERAGSPELPLGPEVIVRGEVPLRAGAKETIGQATLTRDERGIWAEAVITLDAWERLEGPLFRHPAERWPKLAVGILKPLSENGVITSGKVVSLSLVRGAATGRHPQRSGISGRRQSNERRDDGRCRDAADPGRPVETAPAPRC